MARLYVNENFPLPAAIALKELGHDVLTMLDTGQTGQGMSDEAVLEFVRQEGRILLSLNRKHFIRLHHLHPDHMGIIVCSFDPDFSALAHRIHHVIESEENWKGRLARIDRPL